MIKKNEIIKATFGLVLFCICSCGHSPELQVKETVSKKNVLETKVKRYGSVIKLKLEMAEQYKELHANPWPEVIEQIRKSNIRNYSIYLKDEYLFGYFEYIGDDFECDMVRMANDSLIQKWWKFTDLFQIPLETRNKGEWWASMEEVFHAD